MEYISGKILTKQGFSKGYVEIEKNEILEQKKGTPPKKPLCKGIVTPSFYNMHTHIGDTFIRFQNTTLPRDIVKLVAPPNGLKHQYLSSATENDIIKGMKKAIQEMTLEGISCFCDFRENGIKGIKLIKKVIKDTQIGCCTLSRPSTLNYKPDEVKSLLQHSDGIAISSLEEWDYDELFTMVQQIKKANKFFSLHVSERIREDIDKVLTLEPDFIIHMTKATKTDLKKVKNHNIPIVICPRSSTFFYNKIPLKDMKEKGNTLLIGTDNGMLHSLNILEEIKHILKHYHSLFTIEELLHAVTYQPRKVLNSKDVIQAANFPTSYLVLDNQSLNRIYNTLQMRA